MSTPTSELVERVEIGLSWTPKKHHSGAHAALTELAARLEAALDRESGTSDALQEAQARIQELEREWQDYRATTQDVIDALERDLAAAFSVRDAAADARLAKYERVVEAARAWRRVKDGYRLGTHDALTAVQEMLDAGWRPPSEAEALRPYVQHRSTCLLRISCSPLREASWCDCGLTALLAAEKP